MAETEAPVVPGAESHRGTGIAGRLGTVDLVLAALAFAGPLAGTTGYLTIIISAGNGLGAPGAFLLTTAVLLVFTVGYAAMTRFSPNPGAFYAYITAGLGRPAGLGASFLILASYLSIGVGFYGFAGLSLNAFITRLGGPDIAWWVCGLLYWITVAVLAYFRVDLSAKVLGVLLVCESVIVVVFDLAVMGQGGKEGISAEPFTFGALTSGELGIALVFTIALFTGFEAIAVYREETVNPERTIGRATYITVAVIGVFYAIASWALITGMGTSRAVSTSVADPAGAFFDVAESYIGHIFTDTTLCLLLTSIFAAHLAIQNVTTRYVYSLATDGIFPRALSVAHATQHSPHRASLVTSAAYLIGTTLLIIAGLSAEEIYAWFAGAAAYTIMLAMCLTSFAVAFFFRRHPQPSVNLWRSTIAPLLAGIAFVAGLVLGTLNFPTLIGGSQTTSNVMLGAAYLILLVGVVTAYVLKAQKPDVYARIGRQ
ncbi:APC family permease [Streptomyces sp. GMR22]|uniref:APC family permease n=1 Tax=Streptomyces sp. GMR22 TaxID=2759524 RepID=UPI0015FD6EB0|nr:APC family permease [Streptomyces sp. GMR22]MBA6440773.1 APC family permease [Streptomyces sp. GMR22]